jgi:hypothetical protein
MLQLITILNRCHRFPGFVYQQAPDFRGIEAASRLGPIRMRIE